jgi:hypothetical protein
MSKDQLLTTTDKYLSLFGKRNDFFSPRAIRTLKTFKEELKGNCPALNDLYTDLGFHFWLDYFDKIKISNDNLASYILMQQFISEVQKLSVTTKLTELTDLFNRFNKEALTPALKEYQETLPPSSFKELEGIYQGLALCLESHLGERKIEEIKNKVMTKVHKLGQEFIKEGLSLGLFRRAFNEAKDIVEENQGMLAVYAFMIQFEFLLKQKQIKTTDLISLKKEAERTRTLMLQIPEIKEVQQFHWLINLFCNFINNYIFDLFESKQRKDVNRFFDQWNLVEQKAEEQNAAIAHNLNY